MIEIYLQLEIASGNKIFVPGCEPTSALTSATLNKTMAEVCGGAMVDVNDALAAIPGSFIKEASNYGGIKRRWFVLPPRDVSCPCPDVVDYYGILRSLARVEAPTVDEFSYCDVVDQGFCPSPDFKIVKKPLADPYLSEGQTFGELGGLL